MFRNILKDLENWKSSNNRKPLIISGARQTGKTYIIREFADNNYDNLIEINFEKDKNIHSIFNETLDSRVIISNLEIYLNIRITPQNTLIFFDEIQACPAAISSLKYFYEDLNQYHIICAGSLLGVAINRKFGGKLFSFPVGKVDQIRLYPMNFEEFLIALDEVYLIKEIEKSYNTNEKLSELLHNKALKLYRDYLSLGGMPEAIKCYLETNSIFEATKISKKIYSDYLNDTSKYCSESESIKNYNCYDSIARQLLKENKNFKYSEVQKGKTSQYFNSAIEWLIHSGIVLKSKLLDVPSLPLSFHTNDFIFRIYLSDVGLLRYKADIKTSNIQDINYRDDMTRLLAENFVACELSSYEIPLYYWTGKANAEIEFMINYQNFVTPLEIKAGYRVTSCSLNVYKNHYPINQVIRTSQKNFGFENKIKSIPLYAIFCLAKDIKNQI